MEVDSTGKPITSASTDAAKGGAGGGSEIPADLPKELHKFYDPATKTVDYAKVAQSIGEAERKISDTSLEKGAIESAYKELAGRIGGGEGAAGDVKKSGRKISVEDIATDPEAAVRSVAGDQFSTMAQPVVDAVIAMNHPEVAQVGIGDDGKPVYRDPEFVAGLKRFVGGMPKAIQGNLGNFETANYVISLYKSQLGKAAQDREVNHDVIKEKGGVFSESSKQPSKAATGKGGKIWSRSEIRELIGRHPEEYARREAEIEQAYVEDRVDLTK